MELKIFPYRWSPMEAEVRIEGLSPIEEISGKIVGPQCRFSSTIEIAYPVNPIPGLDSSLHKRVIIPEPCIWEPETPFVYQFKGSLTSEGKTIPHSQSLGLRHLGMNGGQAKLNGKPIKLKGRRCESLDPEKAKEYRSLGINALLFPVTPQANDLWKLGDEWGFFLLGEILDPQGWEWAPGLEKHPCHFGLIPRTPPPFGWKKETYFGACSDSPPFDFRIKEEAKGFHLI